MTTENILAPVAALTLPDGLAMQSRAEKALAFITEFQITSPEEYALAADELMAIKTRAKAVEDQRTAITGPLNKVLKAVNDLFRGPADLLSRGESILKNKMLAWDQEQERIAAEARRKAEAAAAAERQRLEEEAAQRRSEAEDKAAEAQAAAASGDTQAAELATAAAQRAQAEAATVATTAQLVVAAPVVVEAPKVKGISTSTKVSFEVSNLVELIQHVAKHPELISLVRADEVKLRAYVRGLGTACALPGVRVFEDKTMSARAA